jgi:hypothetical protein
MNLPASDRPSQMKSRLILLLIVALFFSSFFIAWGLRFAGWTPQGHKNYGELLQPPKDFSQKRFIKADGTAYRWQEEKRVFQMIVVPPQDCQTTCVTMMDTLQRIWESQGRQADRLQVLWFGPLPAKPKQFNPFVAMRPDASLQAALLESASGNALPVYVMDYRGFLIMHYHAGFDPSGLRKDLAKLLK